jgi:branched-chain amino acid transport system substrate-binding protein
VQLLAPPTLPTKAATVSAYEVTFHGLAPCGFVIAGSASKPAVTVTKLLRSVFPRASVVGTSGLCEPDSKWTKAVGVSPIVDQLLWCTSPVLPLNDYMGSDSFAKLYKNVHGVSDPSPYALYGYEAADLGIGMVDYLEAEGDRVVGRDAVRTDLFDTSIREAVLGQFGLLANDDSSLSSYGLYHVTPADAEPSYYLTLKP